MHYDSFMTFDDFWQPLTKIYDKGEARPVARWLLEVVFNITMTDIVCGAVERMSADDMERLMGMQKRLLEGEPVQYVAGIADFGPLQFGVAPGVLIPRPETYELCKMIIQDNRKPQPTILDIGTGSGCIACTLAKNIPEAKVTAWDVSSVALSIAEENAKRLNATVCFEERDILKVKYGTDAGKWDIIVSNPPYICDSEADDMASWVLDYEPETALFVPDDDPLLFYLHISNYAQSALSEGGRLYFEINPHYDEHIEDILLGLGFDDIIVREDQFGKNRFVRATWHAMENN